MYEVYKITCSVNGKHYVGYTKQGTEVRFREHLDCCRSQTGALARAISKYGKEAFSVEVLWRGVTHAEACVEEIRLIAESGTLKPGGYNLTYGGDGVPMTREQYDAANAKKRGRCTPRQRAWANRQKGTMPPHLVATLGNTKGSKWSSERRAKCKATWARKRLIKDGLLEAPAVPQCDLVYEPRVAPKVDPLRLPRCLMMTKEQRRFARRYAAGLIKSKYAPRSDETKEKIRQGHLGKTVSEETKAKLRAANLGKKYPPESIERRRLASTGRKHSIESLAKMSRVQNGRIFSDESRAKMSSAQKGHVRKDESILRQKQTWALKRITSQAARTYFGGFG